MSPRIRPKLIAQLCITQVRNYSAIRESRAQSRKYQVISSLIFVLDRGGTPPGARKTTSDYYGIDSVKPDNRRKGFKEQFSRMALDMCRREDENKINRVNRDQIERTRKLILTATLTRYFFTILKGIVTGSAP